MDFTPMDDVNCGNFYDQIDDLIDYPLDNECSNGGLIDSGDCKIFPSIWDGALPDAAESLLLGSNHNLASDLSAEISVPYEDILQLEWLSTLMEDSLPGGDMTLTMDIVKKEEPSQKSFLSTSSPVSVLESSSSGLKSIPITPSHHVTQRARTKRPRPATFSPCTSVQLISPNPSRENLLSVLSGISSESESVGESENGKKYHKHQGMEEKMKKMITPKIPLGPTEIKQNNGTQAVRRCHHCAISKTPQWRGGPMGPKTLCNACGVRYKSGRLFPEYRPAASPTFVPCLHSNSHRKVIEMRNKLVEEKFVDAAAGNI